MQLVAQTQGRLLLLGLAHDAVNEPTWTGVVDMLAKRFDLLERGCPPPLSAGVALLSLACSTAVKRARGAYANCDDTLKLAALVRAAAAEVMDVLTIGGPLPSTIPVLDVYVRALAVAIDAASDVMEAFCGKHFLKSAWSTNRDAALLHVSLKSY